MKKASPFDDVNDGKLLHYGALFLLVALYVYCLILVLSSDDFEYVWLFPVLISAHYFADLLSGVVHFVLDYTQTKPGTGLRELYFYKGNKGSIEYLGMRKKVMAKISPFEKVAFDFKTHHLSPAALGRRSFLRLIFPGMYGLAYPWAMVSLLLLLNKLVPPEIALFIINAGFGAAVCQYSHSCAHQKKPKVIPMLLQRLGLFLTPKQHNIHHMNLGKNFCILNGWANPVVNRIFNYFRKKGWIFDQGLEPL